MRIVLKILLFPATLALSIIIVLFRFLCDFSGALLTIVSLVIFTLALLTLILLRDPAGALTAAIAAFLISPYGIPAAASWLLNRLNDLNYAIKSL